MSLAALLTRAWLRKGPLACLLWPWSCVMRGAVSLRRHAYHAGWLRSERMPVPVLVVGNRIVGGAGKTPTTIALLRHLRAQGWRPGVLSRGYGARNEAANKANDTEAVCPLLIDAATADRLDAARTGDEPLLIWRTTGVPIMVGRDRAAGGRALLAAHPEIDLLVCDDGLQHLKLQRDVEVIVFDERGAGNGWLLPAGPLREPIDAPPPPGLRTPPIVLYNAAKASTPLPGHLAHRRMAPLRRLEEWWVTASDTWDTDDSAAPPPMPTCPEAAGLPANALATNVWAVAGIAQPQRFFDALAAIGIRARGVPLDDHAAFATLPWPPGVPHVIVTEKDAVKLDPARVAAERPGCQVWVAALDFRPEASFWTAIDAALAAWKTAGRRGARA